MTTINARIKRARQPLPQGSLGPVADLESHLPEEWWRNLFNALYVKTDGDVVENDDNTRLEVDFIVRSTGVTAGSQILDMCCGQGRHALELARRGFRNVTGIDRSRYLIRLAKKRAQANQLDVSFRQGDARTPRLPEDSVDCVCVMGNSFGYFSDKQDDEKVLKSIGKILRQSGTLVLDIADGKWLRTHHEPRSWEWIDEHHFVCRERSMSADGERLISREVIVHDELGVLADQFYAERLYTQEAITQLLEATGFRNVRYHGRLDTRSDREQDLGMMAHRNLLTADAPVKPRKKNRHAPRIDVTVILGDPRLPDAVKRDGRFNTEDLETVARLKSALAELKEYRFHYLDNHATLVSDLAAHAPDLVFNLCDEGFGNDALKELHIPAILDLQRLPYTGAPPRTLAACYDKALVRAVAVQLDIPVPAESYIRPADHGATLPSVFPAILKPNYGDSSEGITKEAVVGNQAEVMAYLEKLRRDLPGRPVLVQEFLPGREFSVGLLGNPDRGLRALPLLEVDYTKLPGRLPRILGYESKWHPESPYWTQISYKEAELAEHEQSNLVDYSMRLFDRLGCCDYARFDFRTDRDGTIKLLEVNPNPGWCWDGKQNLMAEFAGMSYARFLSEILAAAVERCGVQGNTVSPLSSSSRQSRFAESLR